MRRLLSRRADRDFRQPERLDSASFVHRYAHFSGPRLGEVPTGGPCAAGLVIGLHGLGADERQFEGLLPLELADDITYVGLRAPIPYPPLGFSWYDPTERLDALDHHRVVSRVADFVELMQRGLGVTASNTTVIGYSQGAPLAVALSALRPDVAENIAIGSAAVPPRLTELGPGLPDAAFIAIGDKDPFVDPASLAELQNAWAACAQGLVVRHYAIPHVMSPDVARDVSTWIAATIDTGAA